MLLGCDGALIGFAATATRALVAMHAAVAAGDYAAGKAIWDRLGPLARYCWRPPIRDYRARMKEVLLAQGQIASAAVRRPLLPVDDAERAEIRRLVAQAELT
jgi:4-hydroxy-tetrahydrodipicolinate synthase